MSTTKYYMCGNNGFGQLSAGCVAADIGVSGDITPLCYSHPVQVQPSKHVTFTWSQAWCIADEDSLRCYGYHSDKWNYRKASSVCVAMATKCGLMVQASSGVVRNYLENGKVEHVTVSGVSRDALLQGATITKVYCLNDTHLYEGSLSESEDTGHECRLDFHELHEGSRSESEDTGHECRLDFRELLPRVLVTRVACGFEHTLILTDGGQVMSCGSCSRGQLGHGEVSVDAVLVPRKIETFQGVSIIAIATGGWHSVALSESGDMYVWGWNESGQLGLPCSDKTPSQRPDTSESLCQDMDSIHIQPEPYGLDLSDDLQVAMVTCGSRHTVVLSADCRLFATGWNKYGQLCLCDTQNRDCLTKITWFEQRGEQVWTVSAGAWNTFVVTVTTHADSDAGSKT